tara:strand:+ start:162 stop:341 length:180 start_codon:yes stop_codon:yes gene_type:complete
MEFIEKSNVSLKQKFGNAITGFIKIADGLISIITLGNYRGNFCLMFTVYRKTNNFLLDE